jgi:orotate phosphoribosyltransferase
LSEISGARVARILVDVGALKICLEKPFRFASGMLSPVYCDNRILLSNPNQRNSIISEFVKRVDLENIDAIAGTATAGIPHAAWLAHELDLPMFYVRGKSKAHGREGKIEGGEVSGLRILLIEDLVTTGGSAINAIQSLREARAKVVSCLSIFSYGFTAAATTFEELGVPYDSLCSFAHLFDLLKETGNLKKFELAALEGWYADPMTWESVECR